MITSPLTDGGFVLDRAQACGPWRRDRAFLELDELHGAEEKECAAHQHGGADGSLCATAPSAELGQRVHHLNGFVVGGVAELIDRRGRHLSPTDDLPDGGRKGVCIPILWKPRLVSSPTVKRLTEPSCSSWCFLLTNLIKQHLRRMTSFSGDRRFGGQQVYSLGLDGGETPLLLV